MLTYFETQSWGKSDTESGMEQKYNVQYSYLLDRVWTSVEDFAIEKVTADERTLLNYLEEFLVIVVLKETPSDISSLQEKVKVSFVESNKDTLLTVHPEAELAEDRSLKDSTIKLKNTELSERTLILLSHVCSNCTSKMFESKSLQHFILLCNILAIRRQDDFQLLKSVLQTKLKLKSGGVLEYRINGDLFSLCKDLMEYIYRPLISIECSTYDPDLAEQFQNSTEAYTSSIRLACKLIQELEGELQFQILEDMTMVSQIFCF